MSIKEALEEVGDLYYGRGFNAAHSIVNSPTDDDIDAAEATVLAMYEQQQKVADDLAEALNNMVAFHVCDNCLWPGHSCREKDCRGVAQVAAAALAAYEKTKEG